jgi:NitT/TauT family transport system permease protein
VTWAAVLLAALTGIMFYFAVVVLERIFIPWHASLRAEEA